MRNYSLLCLGDSYTIGEGVPLHESFPYQLIQLLRNSNIYFQAPEIIAKTGWTTFELIEHLSKTILNSHYDFATLLIGVNNQYRGLNILDFEKEFELLLTNALDFIGAKPEHLIVFSIPDWGVTPFANDKVAENISKEIDQFNAVCIKVSKKYQVKYIDITENTRLVKEDLTLLTSDQLHYSAIEHKIWALKAFEYFRKNF